MTAHAWVLIGLAVLVVVIVTVLCVARSWRLDRLHVRVDGASAGLDDALARRAAVALDVAARRGRPGEPLRAAAERAGRLGSGAAAGEREGAENALTRQLAAIDRSVLPTSLHAELIDAEQLVILARRVHSDAVRDTLDLRSRRLVRWLRLHGTAPLPQYFEIADPEPVAARRTTPA